MKTLNSFFTESYDNEVSQFQNFREIVIFLLRVIDFVNNDPAVLASDSHCQRSDAILDGRIYTVSIGDLSSCC